MPTTTVIGVRVNEALLVRLDAIVSASPCPTTRAGSALAALTLGLAALERQVGLEHVPDAAPQPSRVRPMGKNGAPSCPHCGSEDTAPLVVHGTTYARRFECRNVECARFFGPDDGGGVPPELAAIDEDDDDEPDVDSRRSADPCGFSRDGSAPCPRKPAPRCKGLCKEHFRVAEG